MDTTWWADKRVQADRDAFNAAVRERIPVWEAAGKRGATMLGIGYGDWVVRTSEKQPPVYLGSF